MDTCSSRIKASQKTHACSCALDSRQYAQEPQRRGEAHSHVAAKTRSARTWGAAEAQQLL